MKRIKKETYDSILDHRESQLVATCLDYCSHRLRNHSDAGIQGIVSLEAVDILRSSLRSQEAPKSLRVSLQAAEEFKAGKHEIGYVSSTFGDKFKKSKFHTVSLLPRSIALPRRMTDSEIESELKPGLCTLGDVLAILNSKDKTYRDGKWNLFYFGACVVSVRWRGDAWDVRAWARGGRGWPGGARVFSPATDRDTEDTLTLQELDTRIKKIETVINPQLLKSI